jgi:protein decreased size exclusion limit 1
MTTRTASAGKRPRPSPHCILRGHESPVSALSFLTSVPIPRLLASGDQSGVVRVWDASLEECVLRIAPLPKDAAQPIISIVGDASWPELLMQSKSGAVRSVDLATGAGGAPEESLGLRRDTVVCKFAHSFCGIRGVGSRLIAGPSEESGPGLGMHDLRLGSSASVVKCSYAGYGRGALMSIDCVGGRAGAVMCDIAAGYEDGSVAIWDMRAADSPVSSAKVACSAVTAVTGCPMGGKFVVAGSAEEDLCGLQAERMVASGRLRGKGVAGLSWRCDGRVLASAGWDGRVRMWDGRRRKDALLRPLASLSWHYGQASCLTFCEKSLWLASGGADKTIALWNVYC